MKSICSMIAGLGLVASFAAADEYYAPQSQVRLGATDNTSVFINYSTKPNVSGSNGACYEVKVSDVIIVGSGVRQLMEGTMKLDANVLSLECDGQVCRPEELPRYDFTIGCEGPGYGPLSVRMVPVQVELKTKLMSTVVTEGLIDPVNGSTTFKVTFSTRG